MSGGGCLRWQLVLMWSSQPQTKGGLAGGGQLGESIMHESEVRGNSWSAMTMELLEEAIRKPDPGHRSRQRLGRPPAWRGDTGRQGGDLQLEGRGENHETSSEDSLS